MTNLQEQIRRYADQGMPSDEIAAQLKVEHSLIKIALGEQSAVLKEDISDEEFQEIKSAVKEIALNPLEESAVRLNALKFMWERKRLTTSAPGNHVPNFMLVLNQQINNARQRTEKYVSEFTDPSPDKTA